ncbi:MAG: hypothetical protein ACK5KL_02170 [Dysgonomonas sp.]
MIDIKAHNQFLKEASQKLLIEDKRLFALWCMDFLLRLPDALQIINKYNNLNETEESLMQNLAKGNVAKYQEAIEKTLNDMDEYADDYEEIDYPDIEILSLFDHCVCTIYQLAKSTIQPCGEGVINLLDYYEQFAEEPGIWTELLEREITNQHKFVDDLINKIEVYETKYHEIYDNVNFVI